MSLTEKKERHAILEIVGDVADSVCENVEPYDRFLFEMESILFLLFDRLIAKESRMTRKSILIKLIGKGKAEAWIMYVVSIIYEANKPREKVETQGTEVWLSDGEKKAVRQAVLKRLESLINKHDDNKDRIYSKHHLRTWKMLCADVDIPLFESWIKKETKSDEGFLRLLGKFENSRLTEKGITRILELGSLKEFIDLNYSKNRLRHLSDKRNSLQREAERLFVAFKNSN